MLLSPLVGLILHTVHLARKVVFVGGDDLHAPNLYLLTAGKLQKPVEVPGGGYNARENSETHTNAFSGKNTFLLLYVASLQ